MVGRRRVLTAGAVATVGGLGAGTAMPGPAVATGPGGVKVHEWRARTVAGYPVVRTPPRPQPVPDPGGAVGHYRVLLNDLLDDDDHVVGQSAGQFLTIDDRGTPDPADDISLATVVLRLTDGTITLAGWVQPGGNNTIAVTGGTGAYTRARGEMLFTPKDGPINRYELRLRH